MAYLTVKDAAIRLNVVERTVRNWLESGKLKGQHVGRKWLITEVALVEVMKSEPQKAPNRPPAGRSKFEDDHCDELMAYGMRLRDRLFVPIFRELFEPGLLWRGEVVETTTGSFAERRVAELWGARIWDQRIHPLFPAFKAHLGGSECWPILESIGKTRDEYHVATWRVWRVVEFATQRCLPNWSPDHITAASEAVLIAVLRRMLWLFPESGVDPRTNARQMLRCRSILDPTYPTILREVTFSQKSGRFRIQTPRDYSEELEPPVQAILGRQRMPQTLMSWRRYILDLAELVIRWQKVLGPDHVLRNALAKGECEWCPP